MIHKIIAGRPRDIDDIKAILLKNPVRDNDYLSVWLREFDKGPDAQYAEMFLSIRKELND